MPRWTPSILLAAATFASIATSIPQYWYQDEQTLTVSLAPGATGEWSLFVDVRIGALPPVDFKSGFAAKTDFGPLRGTLFEGTTGEPVSLDTRMTEWSFDPLGDCPLDLPCQREYRLQLENTTGDPFDGELYLSLWIDDLSEKADRPSVVDLRFIVEPIP